MRLKRTVRSETVINKSRFITCARPVHTEEEARAFIAEIRKEFPDSTHVCTAYVLSGRDIQRSSDNGEPAGTAGIPILEAIRHAGLTDTCVAVVRYFGGIKLGTGGLARAYGGCTQSLLNESPKVEDKEVTVYSVTYPYSLSGVLEGWIRHLLFREAGKGVMSPYWTAHLYPLKTAAKNCEGMRRVWLQFS